MTKQTLHELIDQIEDPELITLYGQLLARELRKSDPTVQEMNRRAALSEEDIAAGRTKNFEEFNADFEAWKARKRANTQ